MYEINRIPFGKTYLLKLSNSNTGEYVTILPELGAALHQVCLGCRKSTFPLLWSSNDGNTYFEEVLPQYRGALLLPFVDRIENGVYSFEGVKYALLCNEPGQKNALHGFMNDKPFQVTKLYRDEKKARVVLFFHYEGNHPGYPFPFVVNVCYDLNHEGIYCITKVQNKARCNIPIGMGWHPYFQVNGNLMDYEINIPAVSSFRIREDFINTGEELSFGDGYKFLALNNFDFNVFTLRSDKGMAKMTLRDKSNETDISIECRGFSFLQLYRVAGKAIAIEPVTCIGNAFNNGAGLTILSQEEIMETGYSIHITGLM